MKTLFILRKSGNRAYQDGLARIYIRISGNGKRQEIATGVKVLPKEWDSIRQRVKGNNESTDTANKKLAKLKNKIDNIYLELCAQHGDEKVTTKMIVRKLRNKDAIKKYTIVEAFERHNKSIEPLAGVDYSPDTIKRFKISLNRLKKFLKYRYSQTDCPIEYINKEFLSDYQSYLRTEFGCSHNTSVKYIKHLKKIMRMAHGFGWIQKNPTENYKAAEKPVNRVFLTDEELKRIENKLFEIPRLALVKDIFRFACYTGLSYSDLAKLSKENLVIDINNRPAIEIYRNKTNQRSFIPLIDEAIEILEKYKDYPKVNDACLLPILSNQNLNSYLKEIADVCGITKNLSMHVARHTFATTITMTNGVPMESVSKMLGHSSLKVTQQYARVVDVKIRFDMKNISRKNDNDLETGLAAIC